MASPAIPARSAVERAAPDAPARVQPFLPADIAEVVDLHRRVFSGNPFPPDELRTYFRQLFFENPSYDREIPSLVYREDGGRIRGFLGVVPRQMRMAGQPVRVALSSQFMVDPQARNRLAAVELLTSFLAGPQDLSLTDGATDRVRKIWQGLGGVTAFPYSIHWERILRPARYVLQRCKERGLPRPLQLTLRPGCGLADFLAARISPSPFYQAEQPPEEGLTCSILLEHLPKLSALCALRPDYDEPTLSWLLQEAAAKKCHGRLRMAVVRDDQGQVAGWYLYYLSRNGVSQVLQVTASRSSMRNVLKHLFYHAWRLGACAIAGRVDPRFIADFSAEHCGFRLDGPWMLLHSRRAELREVIQRGDAFLTRLDGEWFMRFQGG
ncbi:MAG TPA: GNAT family N-acetyltransferase [Terriglobales bacterium]|jgi:hypothetical protein|nr:GNAT family N-acetyltransferase [Terriglobales bacterium]